MLAGYFLARAGVDVLVLLVLEKHADLLRDFYGRTIRLLEPFRSQPHQKVEQLSGGGQRPRSAPARTSADRGGPRRRAAMARIPDTGDAAICCC